MINEQEAREMMLKLSNLKKKFFKDKTEENKIKYFEYETECVNALSYFVEMRAGRYRKFANHSDLAQDGMVALLKAIRSFKLMDKDGNESGSFFYWLGLHVNTKLSRSANNHTAIRFPMHYAKLNPPRKESALPVLLDTGNSPEKNYEMSEVGGSIRKALNVLSDDQRELINLAYGFEGNGPMSISKVCEVKNISRSSCIRIIDDALKVLRKNIEI